MKTIRQVLGDYSDEQLAPVLRLWSMTGEQDKGTKQQVDTLIKRMQNSIAARFAWELLTPDERQILYRVLPPSTRQGTQQDNLIKRAQLLPTHGETAIHHLVELALLQASAEPSRYVLSSKKSKTEHATLLAGFNESADSLYLVSREFFTPSGDRTKWDMERLLDTLSENEIYRTMQNYNEPWGHYYSRSDAVSMLVDALVEMKEPLDHLPNFDSLAYKLFVWLRKHDGKASLQAVREFMKVDDATLFKTLHILAQHGLAFDSFSKSEHVLFVPELLYNNMRRLTANQAAVPVKEDEGKLVELENEPAAVRPGENIAVYDIAMLVNTIYQQTIEPTQAGRVPKRIATKIRSTLRGQPRIGDYDDSDEYIEILLEVMRQFHIIQLTNPQFQDSKPAYEMGSFIEKWAEKSLLYQTHALVRYWIDNFGWPDVYGVNYTPWSTYSWDAAGGRKALINQLYKCIPGRWYTVDSLLQVLWKEDAFAYRPAPAYGRAKLRKDADTKEKWNRCEGEVYRGILSSTLRELGIVDVGYKHPDALSSTLPINQDYFMVTELGRRVMAVGTPGLDSQTLEEHLTPQSLVIQPNFELLLLQPDIPTLYKLLPFAHANQLSLVSRLTLTKASVLRGLQSGMNIEQILRVLQEHSQKELPQNVDYTLRDWTRTFKSAKLSQVLLFEVSSEEAGQILTVLPSLQELGVRQLAPCIFAVSGSVDLKTVRKELEKVGVFVHISGEIFSRPKNPYESYFTYGRY
ncbi:MAG: hypothetical protein NVSMB49_16390 [Ktedonobacteraceae bacterium]